MSTRGWIRILLLIWAAWLLSMIYLSIQQPPIWIARDAITRNSAFIELEALIPIQDGTRVRLATTAPGIIPPAPVAVKKGRARIRVPLPEGVGSHGMHLWSALPADGGVPRDISNGTLTILDSDAPWIAIDIDPLIADRPWKSLGSEDPPIPHTAVLDGLLRLSQHAVLVCSTQLREDQLPLFRKWWDRHSFPVSVIYPESDLISLSALLTSRLGAPVFQLTTVDRLTKEENRGSLSLSALPVSRNPADWQQVETQLLNLLAQKERERR